MRWWKSVRLDNLRVGGCCFEWKGQGRATPGLPFGTTPAINVSSPVCSGNFWIFEVWIDPIIVGRFTVVRSGQSRLWGGWLGGGSLRCIPGSTYYRLLLHCALLALWLARLIPVFQDAFTYYRSSCTIHCSLCGWRDSKIQSGFRKALLPPSNALHMRDCLWKKNLNRQVKWVARFTGQIALKLCKLDWRLKGGRHFLVMK